MSKAPVRTPEAHLVMEALKPAACRDNERLGRLAKAPDLDLPELEHWTAHHGAAGFIVRSLSEAGVAVPPGIRQQARLIRLRNLMLTAALVDAVRALEKAGIRAISLKGPLLSQVLHADAGIRPSNDIDLLVPAEEATRARHVLHGIGFSVDAAVPGILVDSDQFYHTGLLRGGVRLELHRRLYSTTGPAAPFDDLWAARGEVLAGSASVPVLGTRDRVLFLSIHGAIHGFICLKWLADLAAIAALPRQAPWEEVVDTVRGREFEVAFFLGWRHLEEEWGTPLPGALRRELGRARRSSASLAKDWFSAGRPAGAYAGPLHRLRLLPAAPAMRNILVLLFRPSKGEWELIPWLSPRTPLIFSLIRPFRLVIRLSRSLLFRSTGSI